VSSVHEVHARDDDDRELCCADACPMSYYGDGDWRCVENGWRLDEGRVPDWCRLRTGPLTIALVRDFTRVGTCGVCGTRAQPDMPCHSCQPGGK
jgi:hypothetical protein